MEKRILLAKGRRADVFAWGDNRVLKLFHDSIPPETVNCRARIAQMAYNSGIKTPRVEEILEVDDRRGIVFERVDGATMLDVLGTQPWQVCSLARAFAECHFTLHQCSVLGLDSAKNALEQYINRADGVSVELRQMALGLLSKLPNGECLCHGDFHPGQVIVSSEGLVVIDWGEIVQGTGLVDVAITSNLLRIDGVPSAMSVLKRLTLRLLRNVFLEEYKRHYLQVSGTSPEELRKWECVVAVMRLIKAYKRTSESEKRRVLKVLQNDLS